MPHPHPFVLPWKDSGQALTLLSFTGDDIITNPTLLSERANKEFNDQAPWQYAPKAVGDKLRLTSHLVPDAFATSFMSGKAIADNGQLEQFLAQRAQLLVQEAKNFLKVG